MRGIYTLVLLFLAFVNSRCFVVDKMRCSNPETKLYCDKNQKVFLVLDKSSTDKHVTAESVDGTSEVEKSELEECEVCCSISECIQNAKPVNGSAPSIFVSPGIYDEVLTITSPLKLQRTKSAVVSLVKPVITGQSIEKRLCVIYIKSNSVHVIGFEISADKIHGICFETETPNRIEDINISESLFVGLLGSILKFSRTTPTSVYGMTLENNTFMSWHSNDVTGLDLEFVKVSKLLFSGNKIKNAVYAFKSSGLVIDECYDCNITGNDLRGDMVYGIRIGCLYGNNTLKDNLVDSNVEMINCGNTVHLENNVFKFLHVKSRSGLVSGRNIKTNKLQVFGTGAMIIKDSDLLMLDTNLTECSVYMSDINETNSNACILECNYWIASYNEKTKTVLNGSHTDKSTLCVDKKGFVECKNRSMCGALGCVIECNNLGECVYKCKKFSNSIEKDGSLYSNNTHTAFGLTQEISFLLLGISLFFPITLIFIFACELCSTKRLGSVSVKRE